MTGYRLNNICLETNLQRNRANMGTPEVITLPPDRWREAKQLRLEALLTEPTAFASSYEDELAFADEVWIARSKSAYEREGNMTFYAEVEGELVGMAGAHWSARAKLRHVAEVYGVYVSHELRGRSIASRLLRRLLDELRTLGQFEKVSLTVNTEARRAVALYEKMGFEIVGTPRRALRVDGRAYDLHLMELHF